MSAPKATEAAVAAVQQALGCEPRPSATGGEICRHRAHWQGVGKWTERGCPVAVAAADAAAPHIAAQALRDAADVFNWAGDDEDYTAIRNWLRDRADRIEGEP